MSVFSKNLRYLRESRGLKLDEFEFLGIKKGTMSNYELGNTEYRNFSENTKIIRKEKDTRSIEIVNKPGSGTLSLILIRYLIGQFFELLKRQASDKFEIDFVGAGFQVLQGVIVRQNGVFVGRPHQEVVRFAIEMQAQLFDVFQVEHKRAIGRQASSTVGRKSNMNQVGVGFINATGLKDGLQIVLKHRILF
jgi:transcriptional regulator with XRE-family HTH domain